MRVLKGHRGDVRSVAFLPDGRLVSGGGDRTVRVWDLSSGTNATIAKHSGPVYAVAAAAVGDAIAYGGRAAPRAEINTLRLIDSTGAFLACRDLRFSVTVPRWDWNTMQTVQATQNEARSVWGAAFSADGRSVAAVCRRMGGGNIPNGGGGTCWDSDPLTHAPPVALAEDAYAVAFAPVGIGFGVTRYQRVSFYSGPRPRETVDYPLTAMWSAGVAFVPGADLAVVASNSFLDFLNPVCAEKPTRVKTGSLRLTALAASPDGRAVLAGGREGQIEVYDPVARARTKSYDFGVGGLHALAFAPDGLTFAAAGDTGLVVCDFEH